MKFNQFASNNIVLFDGAMGTQIQKVLTPEKELELSALGYNDSPEHLNLIAPEIIENIHRKYFNSGANVAVTNSFGGSGVVLSEFGLLDRQYEINYEAVKIAKKAADGVENRYVAASMGPGTKLISLGDISYDELEADYIAQANAFVDAGADLFIIETCQDIIQIKSAINACKTVCQNKNTNIPIIVSITIDENGKTLLGTEIETAVNILLGYDIFALGLNCSLGPDLLEKSLKVISEIFPNKLYFSPNAGLPKVVNGETVYDLESSVMAQQVYDMLVKYNVNLVGGCCGSDEHYIQTLRKYIEEGDLKVAHRKLNINKGSATSMFATESLLQKPAPGLIGERANANGSKIFRSYLQNDDFDSMVNVAKEQESSSHFLDVCVAYVDRDEKSDMSTYVSKLNMQCLRPLVIDSTNSEVIEVALKLYAGKPIINSINYENGEEYINKIIGLIKRFPACCIALTIDEVGMAKTAIDKFKIAERLYNDWIKAGLYPEDLIIDTLTFTVCSGDKEYLDSAIETLEAIKLIKSKLPGVKTVLGVSNVSFGLMPKARKVLNSVFLIKAVENGLDIAIVDSSKLIPAALIDKAEKLLCENLLLGKKGALEQLINYFTDLKEDVSSNNESLKRLTYEEQLFNCVLKGNKSIDEVIEKLLAKNLPLDILNKILIPAMQEVGRLFGEGSLLLPFVLSSAEVMKKAVSLLEPHMDKDTSHKGTIVIGTVRGDVHDIGKNLVDIIMSNNGYKVVNLGIKVSIEDILKSANENNAYAIGMSGLLVKSTEIMKDNLEYLKNNSWEGISLLGGAALTRSFVENSCEPLLPNRTFYCKDAFDAIDAFEGKYIKKTKKLNFIKGSPAVSKKVRSEIEPAINIPNPPFFGNKIENIDISKAVPYLNKNTLFKIRWGYKDRDNTDKNLKIAELEYARILDDVLSNYSLQPKAIYGLYKCQKIDEGLIIHHDNKQQLLKFPRSSKGDNLSLVDYFSEDDIVGLQVVTSGFEAIQKCKELYESNQYKEYYLYHGFFTELTEAFAELYHKEVRHKLSIDYDDGSSFMEIIRAKYRGKRYSFGYPACPDLEGNKVILDILEGDKIGISLTESFEMDPEFSTSAVVVHHQDAKYF